MPDAFALSTDLAQRLLDALDWIESQYKNPRPRTERREPVLINVQPIRITGAATTEGGTDFYPGRLRRWTQAAGKEDLTAADAVWVFQWNGMALQTDGDGECLGWQVGTATVDDEARPTFATFFVECP